MRLRDLIKQVRSCKTAAEEREVISKESANIRSSFKAEENEYRHRNVAKLLYIHMLGYSTAWGQMECIKLIASNFYSDKRIGYLALMILLDEKQEVLTLVTNHMKNDLNHPGQFIVGLALCAVGNISSSGIARDLAPEVEKLLGSSNPYIRKKAALCAIRVLRKCPDLMENFVPRIRALLSERNHGVLLTGITLMVELCKTDSVNIEFFRRLVPTLVRTLKSLVTSGYAPEYDVSGVTDPFLQVKILQLLRLLGKGDQEASDIMNDILASVATNTDHSRNVGNAILYECVQTVMAIEAESGLRVLAVNVLGRFLSNKDNNIRYVALNTLSKVVSLDAEAVQRHRNTIVDCLKDTDVSIRKRALDLIYALVNESNIKVLAGELLNYLSGSSIDFRQDLATKLCNVTEKYSPNKRWHVDTIVKVMSVAGQHVDDEVANNLVTLVASSAELHSYAVQKLYIALTTDFQQKVLAQVGCWCIGEFGDLLVSGTGTEQEITVTENDVVELLEKILKSPLTPSVTKAYVVTALMKLTSRFRDGSIVGRMRELIASNRTNMDVELQQRANEYTNLFQWENIRIKVLDRIPVVERPAPSSNESPKPQPKQVAAPNLLGVSTPSTGGGLSLDDLLGGMSTPSMPTTAPTNMASLDDLLGGISSPMTHAPAPTAPSGGEGLEFLLGLGGSAPTPAAVTAPAPTMTAPSVSGGRPLDGPLPTFTAFEKNGLRVLFDVAKQAANPSNTLVNITYVNSSPSPFNGFDLKVAVPKYVKFQLAPASGNVIPPSNSGRVTQQLKLINTLQGEKPLLLKVKIDYQVDGFPASELSDVTFPQGV